MSQPENPIYSPLQLEQGARNLLLNCADLKAGERLLLAQEDPQLDWYDSEAPQAVANEALKIGATVTPYHITHVGNEVDEDLEALRAEHDITVFFARAGDQERFSEQPADRRSVMCYTRNAEMLASDYGRTPHQAMVALKQAINRCVLDSRQLEIRCPLGTHFTTDLPHDLPEEVEDVTIQRFPMGVHAPIHAVYGSGRVALADYLTTTGTHVYQPDHLTLDGVVFANVEAGRITGFDGSVEDVKRVQNHYQHVSELFDIDPDVVNSWHAGIHGGSPYTEPDASNPERWGNTVFTHPKLLHFHTCGGTPGEIAWNVKDADVTLDGVFLWQAGRLCLENFPELVKLAEQWPALKTINSST